MKIEERARAVFKEINEREYRCALAESQVDEMLFNQVKKTYEVAENAFVQGVLWCSSMKPVIEDLIEGRTLAVSKDWLEEHDKRMIDKMAKSIRSHVDPKLIIYHNDSWCNLDALIAQVRKDMEE